MKVYLSPNLTLKESVDLLVLTIFVEPEPLQPMKMARKVGSQRLVYCCTLEDRQEYSDLPHSLLAAPWCPQGTLQESNWRGWTNELCSQD